MSRWNKNLGDFGESRAAEKYQTLGFKILDRNWRIPAGEIDIVACRASDLVFIEVKTRSSDNYGTGAESVNRTKQIKIRTLASTWLDQSKTYYNSVRFDVAEVDAAGNVNIIEDCF